HGDHAVPGALGRRRVRERGRSGILARGCLPWSACRWPGRAHVFSSSEKGLRLMKQPAVLFEIDMAIATISLNDGDRLNPLGDEASDGLIDAVDKVREEKQVRAVILTGRGRGFCVGADLAHYRKLIEQPEASKTLGQYV